MAAAYIEHRLLASDRHADTTHHVVVSDGREAGDWAIAQGYKPAPVTRGPAAARENRATRARSRRKMLSSTFFAEAGLI